tara:strand:+ start:149 stop:418 length:270 start_codon:yes stop_codon:yes gene_type:complete
MDFEIIKETQQRANNDLRDLVSLEQIAGEFYINDPNDPLLYAMYKVVNDKKLTKNEIITIDYTIELLLKKQQKINDYNLSILVNDTVPN